MRFHPIGGGPEDDKDGLIGVEEVKGGRSEFVGVENHLDDANLHQFVNSKTNRPAEFSYFPCQVEDKQIGVLSIPIQSGPVYVISKYGKRRQMRLQPCAAIPQGLLSGQLLGCGTWRGTRL